ncbi:MAG: NTP transferase domain-containing protein [Dermatophilaceae bacterium]
MTGGGATVAPKGERQGDWAAIVLAGGRAARMAGTDKIRADVGGQSVLGRVLAACAGARIVVVGPPELADVVDGTGLLVREHPPFDGPVAGCRAGLAALDADGTWPPAGVMSLSPGGIVPRAAPDGSGAAGAAKPGAAGAAKSGAAGAAKSSAADPGPAQAGASGLSATLRAATYRRIALLAGDQPQLTADALGALHRGLDTTGVDAAVLADATGQWQYLCALWDAESLRTALMHAGSSMRSLYAAVRVSTVPDTWGASRDIDTPADLQRARDDLGRGA